MIICRIVKAFLCSARMRTRLHIKQTGTMPQIYQPPIMLSLKESQSYFQFYWHSKGLKLRRGAVCQILRFISTFLWNYMYILYINYMFWKYFHSKVIWCVSSNYYEKSNVKVMFFQPMFFARLPKCFNLSSNMPISIHYVAWAIDSVGALGAPPKSKVADIDSMKLKVTPAMIFVADDVKLVLRLVKVKW